jgi:methylthioribose-1-phosphate isomerase
MFSAMKYQDGVLSLIDQRLLPSESIWIECRKLEEVAKAIEDMVVRGAPAIGCTAAFGFVVDALQRGSADQTWAGYKERFEFACKRLGETRPTAVNLFEAIKRFKNVALEFSERTTQQEVIRAFEATATSLFDQDLQTCKAIGDHGAALARANARVNVLTHCNTGSLATAGYGTALGIIRSLHNQGKLGQVYVDETRPYLQGTRLTAYELLSEKIPFQLITDSCAAYLMQQGKIDWAVVGADRIAANGDTANKIGTYSVAVNAKHHGVKFYVAAPLTTFDPKMASGAEIPVELRSPKEMTHFRNFQIAPVGTEVYNPSFDVTPSALITSIVTERGVVSPPYRQSIAGLF